MGRLKWWNHNCGIRNAPACRQAGIAESIPEIKKMAFERSFEPIAFESLDSFG